MHCTLINTLDIIIIRIESCDSSDFSSTFLLQHLCHGIPILILDNIDHSSKPTRTNWRIHWQIYVDEWADVDHRLVHIAGPYDIHFRSDYMQWYESDGMCIVFF
jgi:hypothetical protein